MKQGGKRVVLKKGSLICDARQEVTGAPGRVVPGNLEGIWSCGRHLGTGRGARKSDRATAEYHVLFCGVFPSFLLAMGLFFLVVTMMLPTCV